MMSEDDDWLDELIREFEQRIETRKLPNENPHVLHLIRVLWPFAEGGLIRRYAVEEYGDFETTLVFECQRNSKLPYRAPTTIIVRSQMYSSDATRSWKKLCSIPSGAKALDGGQLIAAARRRGSERKTSKVDDVGAEKIKTMGDS